MVESMLEFCYVSMGSNAYGFHPVFCSVYVGIRAFSRESFEFGWRNSHFGIVFIVFVLMSQVGWHLDSLLVAVLSELPFGTFYAVLGWPVIQHCVEHLPVVLGYPWGLGNKGV